MPAWSPDRDTGAPRRQLGAAIVVLLLSLTALYLPDPAQQQIASALRASVLRPFVSSQERITEARLRAAEVEELRAALDSLTATMATQAALDDENRNLRSLLELSQRVGPRFRSATALRPGTPGSESMFLVSLGAEDGVQRGAPVMNRHGLVGVIREVRETTALGMDWTHPDFRASAMVVDGTAFGMVETRRGAFREEDRLVLTGGAYHEQIPVGTLVVTSGLGGVFPRGIPIGRIAGVEAVGGQWRKSYWLDPLVQVGEATHVLVAVGSDTIPELSAAFPPDSTINRRERVEQRRALEDSLAAVTDSVIVLRARLEEMLSPIGPGDRKSVV